MNCLIIDSDSSARLNLVKLCNQSPHLQGVDEFSSAKDGLEFLTNYSTDFLFFNSDSISIEELNVLRDLDPAPSIILVSENEIDLDSLNLPQVIAQIHTSIQQEDFCKLMDTIQSEMLCVKSNKKLLKIPLSDIQYVQAKGDYILIKTAQRSYIVHSTLTKILNRLPTDHFLKVHRSYIINVSKIDRMSENSVLISEEKIPVSRPNRKTLKKHLDSI